MVYISGYDIGKRTFYRSASTSVAVHTVMAVCIIVMTSNLLIAHSEHEFHGMFHISYIHCILYLFIYLFQIC